MNRKGFTLIELLATIVIIGIIMSLVFPSAVRMNNENDLRICQEYETMMEEYARVNFNKMEDYIDLIELEELDNIKSECDGYVIIDHSTNPVTYKAYVSCPSGCKTEGFQEKDSRTITIIIKANDITTTYLENIPSFSYNMESSVDLLGANPLTSMVTYKVVDSKGDVVEVNSNTPAGEYTIIPSTTVKSKYRLVIQDGTLTINKIQCQKPTNVKISTSGIITWTGSSNCPESHQLRINNGEGEVATSGVNKKSVLISSPGNKKVYIKAIAPNSNYSDSQDATKSINVYSVALTKGSEISSVTGSGNYIKGETVTISATQNSGKIWNHWIDTNTSEEISTNQTYSATISSNWNYTAVAYNKLNNVINVAKKECNYSGSGCAATVTATSGTPTIKYYTNNSCTSGESSSAPVNVGTYYVIATVPESTTYFAGNSGCQEAVTINKVAATLTCANRTYNGSAQNMYSAATGCSSVTNGSKTNAGGPWTLTCNPDSNHTAPSTCTATMNKAASNITCKSAKNYSGSAITSYSASSGCESYTNDSVTDAGTYTVTCNGDSNHNDSTCSFTVNKVAATLTCANRTYTGSAQNMYSAATGCSSVTNGSKTNAGGPWTLTCNPDSNHTAPSTCTATMNKASSSITCKSAKNYSGSAITSYSASSGCESYTNGSVTNAGTYTVTCKGDSNHNNSTCSFTVNTVAATLTCSNKDYNGAIQTGCTCSGGTIGGTYQAKDPGSYVAKCTADSNHYSPANKNWTINHVWLFYMEYPSLVEQYGDAYTPEFVCKLEYGCKFDCHGGDSTSRWRCQPSKTKFDNSKNEGKYCWCYNRQPGTGATPTPVPSGNTTCNASIACAGLSGNPCWQGSTCYYGAKGGTTGYDCTQNGGIWQCGQCYSSSTGAKCS